jgi:general secretion pathway protein J
MTRANRRSHSTGFTLVEALVATLLMGIILAALAMVTAHWLPGWNRGFTRLQHLQLLTTGLDRLTADLAAAQFISVGAGNDPPLFDGDGLSVTFIRTTLAPNAGTGLEVVRIAETSDDDGAPVLVRSTAPLPLGNGQGADATTLNFANPVVVIRAPYRVSFSYAGPDRLWRDDWHNQLTLPHAIRIQIRDNATSTLLAATTSTLVYSELPASCTWTGVATNCPMAGARLPGRPFGGPPGPPGGPFGGAVGANPPGAPGGPFGGAVGGGQ